jgi:large subunit ribosomal protein L25
MITLDIKKRDAKENLGKLRTAGFLPAVFYGRKEKSTPISIPAAQFEKIWKQAGESTVIALKGDGLEIQALIHEIDFDPVTDVVRHADFYAIEKGQKVKVNVPVEFVGVAPAVKDLHGTLIKVMHDIEVEAEPANLPHKIEIDISALVDFSSTITAGSAKLPAGVTLVSGSDEVVASVYETKEEVVEAVAADISQIEVEKKGKEAKEGEEGAAPADAPKK